MTQQAARHKGFTLIELLVVLVILGVIISLAVAWVHPLSDARRLDMTVQQTRRILLAAEQEAVLTPAVLGLKITAEGLTFYRYTIEKDKFVWKPLKPDHLSNPMLFKREKIYVKRVSSTPEWLVISASGDVTPFVLMYSDRTKTNKYKLSVNAAGAINLKKITGEAP